MINSHTLCLIMDQQGISTKTLSDISGVPEDTIKNLRYGRSNDSKINTIISIADALSCSVDDLIDKEELFLTGKIFANEYIPFLNRYRPVADAALGIELSLAKQPSSVLGRLPLMVYIPLKSDNNAMVFKASSYGYVNAFNYASLVETHDITFGFQVINDTLSPIYRSNDILLISNDIPHSGDIVLVLHRPTKRLYIRKYYADGAIRLEPITTYGACIRMEFKNKNEGDEWHIMGKVITHMRETNLALF